MFENTAHAENLTKNICVCYFQYPTQLGIFAKNGFSYRFLMLKVRLTILSVKILNEKLRRKKRFSNVLNK